MRLLFAATSFPRLSETFVTDQIIGLHELGHEIDVFTTHPQDIDDIVLRRKLVESVGRLYVPPSIPMESTFDWLSPRRQPSWARPQTWSRLFRVASSPGFRRMQFPLKRGLCLLDAPNFDAVVSHFGPAGVMMQQMRDIGLIRAPLATFFHGYDISNYLNQVPDDFYERLFASGDLFLPISDLWRVRLAELGCPVDRTRLQRLGTKLDEFTFVPRVRLPNQPMRLLSVARLVQKKGVEYGIRAVARLASTGLDVIYDVVGDGPLRGDLERLAESFDLGGSVNFLGALSHADVANLMRRHHVLLVPSVTDDEGGMEGIPVVIMEAMATGLLVVATQHSGIPEIVRHEENGLLAPERDDKSLAELLIAIHDDESRWHRLVLAGRETVDDQYNLDRQNAALAELLSGL